MQQSDFLDDNQAGQFAELCLALYERELHQLCWSGPDDAKRLKRRLGSLTFYVRHAAKGLTRPSQSPLHLDIQNASWQATQSAKPPAGVDSVCVTDKRAQATATWLRRHAQLGLVLPVQIEQDKLIRVELDSIDSLDIDGVQFNRPALHLNRLGWFAFSGEPLELQTASVLKPTPKHMTSACCGHQWSAAGRKAPRTLSLREVLLAVTLDWPRFTQVLPLQSR
ncbi:hypothetical protein [Aliidiomarina maris]|uniref:Chorismate lyase n=1 Tax=Aliidiomarina maris TaxID=531312 RepID=A0A327X6G4_9GAMM|nr:hypothetical protein [Aliidiomarina maris]RAK01473.1 hypothetical protein B0I24_10196 [Aliidiomarina maris]RUO28310.1 hypothetical protein CWE07_00455 [Aliidiomarina maris]